MASTSFVNGVTLSDADWFNDLDRLHYTIFADPANVTTARNTLLAGMGNLTASLGANVALNNASNFFDGPSLNQGSSGLWDVKGTITVADPSSIGTVAAKLWDGTTVIASSTEYKLENLLSLSLSGQLNAPTGNLRISVKSASTNSQIAFNMSGSAKDSTISAIRIG